MSTRKGRARLTGAGVRLRVGFGAGAAADTNIPITGIRTADELVSVLQLAAPSAATADAIVGDRTGETSITSDGNIQLDTTATTGNQLLVIWLAR